jgi:hypothetical protein
MVQRRAVGMGRFSFRYSTKDAKLRFWLIRFCAFLQRKKVIFLNSDPKFCARVLQSSHKKGTFIESLVALPAWSPILSLESVDGKKWQQLTKLFRRVYAAVAWEELIPSLVRQQVWELRPQAASDGIDGECIAKLVVRVFYRAIFSEQISARQEQLYYSASLEWRKEVAMKQKGDKQIKKKFLADITKTIESSLLFSEAAGFEQGIDMLSVVAQPFILSPQINFSDIFAALFLQIKDDSLQQKLLIEAAKSGDHRCLTYFVFETMRICHPFPILERELTEDITYEGKIFEKGSQVLVLLDEFCHERDFSVLRWQQKDYYSKYSLLLFGSGKRVCPGKNSAIIFMTHLLAELVKKFPLSTLKTYKNHLYSGRDNDHKDSLAMTVYQARVAIRVLVKSFLLGVNIKIK